MKLYKIVDNQKEEIKLKALLVYDKTTGQIIHRHWYQENEKKPITEERILKLIDPQVNQTRIGLIAVKSDEMDPHKKYQINTTTNLLEAIG